MSDGGFSNLEQFTILAKVAKGKACVALIEQVLSSRKIFVFGEVLAMPNLQALRGTEHENYLTLMEIFAYGTHRDYQERKDSLPELTLPQLHKLRQLSLVSLAHQHESVPYTKLFEELGISEVRELEDLIIETIYAGLIQGRLDQRGGLLRVKSAVGRDVRLEDMDVMIAKLNHWVSSSETLLSTFEQKMSSLQAGREALEGERKEFKAAFEKVKANPQLSRMARATDAFEGMMPGLDSAYDDLMDPSGGGKKFGCCDWEGMVGSFVMRSFPLL